MNRQPKITIIIPIYNTDSHLDKCIKSVLDQTYKNLEILLIDDGSTDNSAEICNGYAKIDKRIRYHYKDNGGVSSARNFGINNARGDYITFVDADDIVTKDAVYLLLKNIANTDVVISQVKSVTSLDSATITNDKNFSYVITSDEAIKKLLYENGINNAIHGLMYKNYYNNKLFFNEDMAYGEDYEFKFHLFLKVKQITINSGTTYLYLRHDSSAMQAPFTMKRLDSIKIALNNLKYIVKHRPVLINAAKHKVFLESVSVLRAAGRKKKQRSIYNECALHIKQYCRGVITDREAPLQHRIYAVISIVNIPILLWLINYKNRLFKV
jgi:glycosyltransferase involved in cell wall biosynthesis